MKNLILTIVATGLLGSLAIMPPATAKTPDGKTPAEETVCDVLRDATPGLYGLCVAYCEAHDAELISPTGKMAELNTPNKRILRNYNRKKKKSDPAMPCLLEEQKEEGCPCWTSAQLATAMPPSMNHDHNLENACKLTLSTQVLENFENGDSGPGFQLAVTQLEGCQVTKTNGYAGGPDDGFAPVNSKQGTACAALLSEHAQTYDVPGVVWDCFNEE